MDLSDLKPVTLGSDLSALQNRDAQAGQRGPRRPWSSRVRLEFHPEPAGPVPRVTIWPNENYFGHWNPDGMTANDLRKDYAIAQYVSENIARDVSLPLAEYGLMRSASHRSNILNKEWKRVGFGFSDDGDEGTLFVQIFSDDPINFVGCRRPEDRDTNAILNAERTSAINSQDKPEYGSAKLERQDGCGRGLMISLPPGGQYFFDSLRDAGVNATSGALIIGNSSFEGAKTQILANTQLKESRWKNHGHRNYPGQLRDHQHYCGVYGMILSFSVRVHVAELFKFQSKSSSFLKKRGTSLTAVSRLSEAWTMLD